MGRPNSSGSIHSSQSDLFAQICSTSMDSTSFQQMAAMRAEQANQGLPMDSDEAMEVANLLLTPQALCNTEKGVMEYYYKKQKFSQLFRRLAYTENEGQVLRRKLYDYYKDVLAPDDRREVEDSIRDVSLISPSHIVQQKNDLAEKCLGGAAARRTIGRLIKHYNTGQPLKPHEALVVGRFLLTEPLLCDPKKTSIAYYYGGGDFGKLFEQLSKTRQSKEDSILERLYHEGFGQSSKNILREDRAKAAPYFEVEKQKMGVDPVKKAPLVPSQPSLTPAQPSED